MILPELMTLIRSSETGKRSLITEIRSKIIEKGLEADAAEIIQDTVAVAVKGIIPLALTAQTISSRLIRLAEITETHTPTTTAKAGIAAINWVAEIGVVSAKKQNMIIKNKVKPQWLLSSESKEFTEYANSLTTDRFTPPTDTGGLKWTGTSMEFDNCSIDIVKGAKKDGMIHHYRPNRMPAVYDALNRLNQQTYYLNQDLFVFATTEAPNTFIPPIIDKEEIRKAMKGLNDVVRKAINYEEARFIEQNKWIEEEQPERKLAKSIRKYIDIGSIEHKKTIAAHSKRYEYEETVKLAEKWASNGQPINYLYTCDTRGRIYTEQPFFNPLGNDLAKALLLFKDASPISSYDLCLHISNCCGNDKDSFDDRVRWVNDNAEELYLIGTDPWKHWDLIQKLGINKEKTLWQALAALIEYVKYTDYVTEFNTEDGFESRLPIGLDSTSSGTQILTMLTGDDAVAPYVNLCRSPTGKVGDFYTYLADHCFDHLETQEKSETLTQFTQPEIWKKVKRAVAKRNSMTYNYSGTRYGFGTQHLTDKSSYGKIDQHTSYGDMLTPEDCFHLGRAMFDTCEQHIKGSANMMEFLRDGIKLSEDKAILSWTLPDGFTAYQRCAKVKNHNSAAGMIGETKVSVRIEYYSEEGDLYLHSNGIAANWTHSMDSFMLRDIVRKMPEDAPISTVHDMFSTTSYYVADLQEVARDSYKTIADREAAATICESAFGVYRDLPLVGDWAPNQLNEAEFFIC